MPIIEGHTLLPFLGYLVKAHTTYPHNGVGYECVIVGLKVQVVEGSRGLGVVGSGQVWMPSSAMPGFRNAARRKFRGFVLSSCGLGFRTS